jgi:hypothetical protein
MLSNLERINMKNSVAPVILAFVLFGIFISSAYSSVSIEANITRDFHVVFEFTNINSTTYETLKNNALIMNETTVPETIWRNLAEKGLVSVEYYDSSISFNDTTRSVRSAFNLRGPDVITSTINRGALIETFTANTTWRKFFLNISSNFSFNFTQTFATPLSDWNRTASPDGGTIYNFANVTAGASCSFVLPKEAKGVFIVGDAIVFDLPYEPPWEDKLINSPLLILIALAVVGAVIFVYRKVR